MTRGKNSVDELNDTMDMDKDRLMIQTLKLENIPECTARYQEQS